MMRPAYFEGLRKSYSPKKAIPSNYNFRMDWSMSMNMGDGPDENGQDIFVHEYRGKLVLEIDDDEEDEISAGYIKCYHYII